MVFPYVPRDQLQRRLDFDAPALGMSDDDWLTTLDEILDATSEQVENYADEQWRDMDSVDEIPAVVREAVIRLSRARVIEIKIDGLESENTGDSASYNYRSPADIRAEVRSELRAANLDRDGDDPGDVRAEVI